MPLFFKVTDGDRAHLDLVQCPEAEAEYTVLGFDDFATWHKTVEAMDREVQSIEQKDENGKSTLELVNKGPHWEINEHSKGPTYSDNEMWDFWESQEAYDTEMNS